MKKLKSIFTLFSLSISTLLFSQKEKNLLEVEFAYLAKAKLNKGNAYINEEIFLLQVLKDKAYFFGENMAKNDSLRRNDMYKAMASASKNGAITFTGSSRLSTKYHYTIIQSSQENVYLENIGLDSKLYAYQEPIIKDWKLIEENQTINTFNCKKATIHYKGRNWTAWYDESIPLPYGPYKFTGLPGLVVKIESEDGDFSFELVKSTPKNKLNGKELSLTNIRYKNATPATFEEMRKIKKNTIESLVAQASNMGIDTSAENTRNLLERQRQKLLNFENENLIEKID